MCVRHACIHAIYAAFFMHRDEEKTDKHVYVNGPEIEENHESSMIFTAKPGEKQRKNMYK